MQGPQSMKSVKSVICPLSSTEHPFLSLMAKRRVRGIVGKSLTSLISLIEGPRKRASRSHCQYEMRNSPAANNKAQQ